MQTDRRRAGGKEGGTPACIARICLSRFDRSLREKNNLPFFQGGLSVPSVTCNPAALYAIGLCDDRSADILGQPGRWLSLGELLFLVFTSD